MPGRPRLERHTFVGDVKQLGALSANLLEYQVHTGNPTPQAKDNDQVPLADADQMFAHGLTAIRYGDDIFNHLCELPLQITSKRVAAAKANHPDLASLEHGADHSTDLGIRNRHKGGFKIGNALRNMRGHTLHFTTVNGCAQKKARSGLLFSSGMAARRLVTFVAKSLHKARNSGL